MIDDPDAKAITIPAEIAGEYERLCDHGWNASITFTSRDEHIFVEVRADQPNLHLVHRWELHDDRAEYLGSTEKAA